MAARKKATRKKPARPRRGRQRGPLARLEQELPPTLREYTKQVRSQLNRLERMIEKAPVDARRRAARMLREASHRLGRLEKAIAPRAPRGPTRKAAAPKPTRRKEPTEVATGAGLEVL